MRMLWISCFVQQAIESGVLEIVLTDLLPDTMTFNLGTHHVSTFFAPYAAIAPLRWEAITLLQDLTQHRNRVPDMIAELVRQVHEIHSCVWSAFY
jgi:hypothetical protein